MIFLACFLTVLIETPFLAAFGYRTRDDLLVIVCSNAITNLSLNLLILTAFHGAPGSWIYLLEAAVVSTEYLIYSAAFGKSVKLFLLTLTANLISYVTGLLIF